MIDKVIDFLKFCIKTVFTKSLNSVGFLLVVSGVGILNPDLYASLIFAFLEIALPDFEGDDIVGAILIAVGILCFLINHFINRGESIKSKNDKNSFGEIDKIINQQNMGLMIDDIGANCTIFYNHQDVLDELELALENSDFGFYNRKVKSLHEKFHSALSGFTNFAKTNYFPNGSGRYTLRPNMRNSANYQNYIDQQNAHLENLRHSYNDFRESIRSKYKI